MFIMSRKIVNAQKFKELTYFIHSKIIYLHNNWIKCFLLTLGPLLMSLGHLDGWGRVRAEGRAVAL